MSLVVPNVGEQIALEATLNITPAVDLLLRLYTSNTTPGESDTTASYTEATGYGYAPVALDPASWVITPGAPTTAAYPEQTFTFSGALGNVYGYYVTQDDTEERLLFAERFSDGPYDVMHNGDQIAVTLNFTAS